MYSPTSTKPEYVPLATSPDGEPLSSSPRSASPLSFTNAHQVPTYVLWSFLVVALLSTVNITLLPLTLKAFDNLSYTEAELAGLPYPSTRLGLDRAAKALPPPEVWHYGWPAKIAHLSQALKNAVYGDSTQVFISVEDTTIMQFPIPQHGTPSCALTFIPPPEVSVRKDDLETKGDISEIEAWSIISPNALLPSTSSSPDDIDFDTLSWNTRPVRGELLGTLDLTLRPNATTIEFTCPTDTETLTVELRCLRVACHVKFKQVDMLPKFGFELARRHE